ncbi:MAG TPA: U32 family peptidase [Tenuifilaceae bacterium]|nr:U32 family peptidase [Tenuifilaceae bacterium]HPE17096.1 U32 family peptidase [Tenuifilaceae bacterium]HPJ44822.1 U32 family peptidase [Tenuifilaceae bacterium]HPQ32883.1 U32 family peptidase [Tenuifilaceae bacterium]HRX67187.1 U32 family peptidase [Tenuifilaceae bacterium]
MGTIEVMSPAGSFESLIAAIQGGANSVYFGVGHLNMRAKSTVNFTVKDLPEIARICRESSVKSYLTVNTVLYDHDIAPMQHTIDAATQAGISAIIASDQAAIFYAREKGVEVHLSTQLNISNTQSLKFYSQWADVAVLARELTLEQVATIAENIKKQNITGPSGNLVKLELFAHGALCMAISGKCYMSLHQANSSANRGACLQICRRSYTVTDNETGEQLEIDNEYIMSPKDLCTIGFLNKIIDSGVTVLKLEGRARSPEYVKTVTQCYREAVDSVAEGTYNQDKIDSWIERLGKVFNRGFWDGYYLGQRLGEWSHHYGSVATERKLYIGKITNYFSKISVAEVKVEANKLSRNDKVLVIGPSTGVIDLSVEEIRMDDTAVEHCPKGTVCSIKVPELVRRNDKLYKIVAANHS